MPGTAGPHVGLTWGYSPGDDGWGVEAFNPNFATIEALLHLAVLSVANTPPGSPTNGQTYIVGTSPTDAWVGHANDIAVWFTVGTPAWLFLTAAAGYRAYNVGTSSYIRFDGSVWADEHVGDVVGPAGSVSGNLPRYADATGKVLDDSGIAFALLTRFGGIVVPGNLITVNADGELVDTGISETELSGDVTGPATAVSGNLPVFADGTGKVLSDSGLAPGSIGAGDVVGPASSTTGHLPVFGDGTGKLLADASIPAAAVAQTAGTLADGYLLAADASGKVVDSGIAVSALGATVPAGTSNHDQLVWNGSAWTVQRAKYIIGFDLPGVLALDRVFSHVFTKAVTIPDDFGAYLGHSSQARGSVNATSSPVITVAKATAGSPLSFSTVGTITITAGGVVPVFVTTGTTLSFAQGDTVRFKVTTGDTTFADLILTVVAYES